MRADVRRRGQPLRTARLLGAAEALLETTGLPIYVTTDHDLHQRAASAARESLGERAWTTGRDEGRAMAFDEAIAYALSAMEQPAE